MQPSCLQGRRARPTEHHHDCKSPGAPPAPPRTSSGGRSGAAMRPLAASSWRSMRFLYSMSRRLPTIAFLSLPAIALAKSLAPCSAVCARGGPSREGSGERRHACACRGSRQQAAPHTASRQTLRQAGGSAPPSLFLQQQPAAGSGGGGRASPWPSPPASASGAGCAPAAPRPASGWSRCQPRAPWPPHQTSSTPRAGPGPPAHAPFGGAKAAGRAVSGGRRCKRCRVWQLLLATAGGAGRMRQAGRRWRRPAGTRRHPPPPPPPPARPHLVDLLLDLHHARLGDLLHHLALLVAVVLHLGHHALGIGPRGAGGRQLLLLLQQVSPLGHGCWPGLRRPAMGCERLGRGLLCGWRALGRCWCEQSNVGSLQVRGGSLHAPGSPRLLCAAGRRQCSAGCGPHRSLIHILHLNAASVDHRQHAQLASRQSVAVRAPG